MALAAAEEKWYRKAMAGFKAKWPGIMKSSHTLDAFCKGIAAVTGIPEGTVRASLPAKNFADFQANAERYITIAVTKIERAYRDKKWSTNYRRAFGG